MTTTAWLLLAALAAGYLAGRVRPWGRFVAWNWCRTIWSSKTTSADVVLFCALHPVKAWKTLHAKEPRVPTYVVPDVETPQGDA